ncbi:unnamed protein product [Oikopleura dioica]|uniref:RING-type domain-containing protein n=1 Tax=Oikopleura dioica TaxID=34765 RepID=E4XJF8_OIKDI|nr:unnamed protein product [Oikopleura dioica]CBY38902.1 unnamed protein product [Oikopleura dioica]
MNDFYIKDEFANNDRKVLKSCWNCRRYSLKMWRRLSSYSNPTYRCQNCAFGTDVDVVKPRFKGPFSNEILNEHHLHFEIVGNIFKCPNKNCDRQDLSFQEFYSKSCCNNILDTSSLDFNDSHIIDHDLLQKISVLHKKSGILKENAQLRYEEIKKKLEKAEKEMNDKEEEFEKIENKMAHYFSRTLNNITEGKPIEEDNRLFCKICFEKYNDDDRVQCVLLCRHSLCAKCLNTLPDKTCPVCRNPFTDDQIIKLCN